jgi:hypothetical protein
MEMGWRIRIMSGLLGAIDLDQPFLGIGMLAEPADGHQFGGIRLISE